MPLDASGGGAGEVSEIGRPATSAASAIDTPLLVRACPNTLAFTGYVSWPPDRGRRKTSHWHIPWRVRNLLRYDLAKGNHCEREESGKVSFRFAVPSLKVDIMVTGNPSTPPESKAQHGFVVPPLATEAAMPNLFDTQSSAGFDSMARAPSCIGRHRRNQVKIPTSTS